MEDLQTRSPAPAAKEAAAAPQPTTALISSHVLPSAAIQEALGVKADSAAFRFSVQILDTAAPAPGGGPVQGATSAVFSAFDSALPTSTWSRLASRASLLTDLAIRPLGQPVMLNSGLQAFVPEDKSPEWPQNPDDVPDSIP